MGRLLIVTVWLVGFAWFSSIGYAQERPKVGLVLSGGGALGSAHIGVLKALEEMHIPIDMIAGTSMGAIVGGYYAIGYSPAEIEQLLTTSDWQDLFDDEPRRRFMDYRDKFDDPDLLTDFEMGFSKGKFQLPPGLIIGRKLDLKLQMELFDAQPISDFKQLPIPFVAIATDLVKGEIVEMDTGVLADAVRASAAIPGAFAPSLDDQGRLLVDGGMMLNLPVSTLKNRGADFIIAVDVGVDAPDEEDLQKLGEITARIVSLFVRQNVRPEAARADVVVEPDVSAYSSSDFDLVHEMIPIGYQAVQKLQSTLMDLRVPAEAYREQQQYRRLPSFEPLISSIQVTNTVNLNPRILLSRVTVKQGERLSLAELEKSLRSLNQLGYFQTVNFRIVDDPDNEGYHLVLEPISKSWGPHYIRFGLEMATDFAGYSAFNLKAAHRTRPLNTLEGEINTLFTAGEQNRIRAEYFQPWTFRRTWFAAVDIEAHEEDLDTFADDGSRALVNLEFGWARVGVGYHLASLGEIRFSFVRSHGTARISTGSAQVGGEVFEQTDFNFGGLELITTLDRMDNFSFPTDGWFLNTRSFLARTTYGSDEDYELLALNFGVSHTLRDKHTFLTFLDAFSALDSEPPIEAWFEEGGLYSISGFPRDALRGRHGGHVTTAYLYKLGEIPPPLGGGVYIGVTAEAGNLWLDRADVAFDDLILASSISLGIDTAFGPINLAYGFNDTGENQLYFTLGSSF
jgi:NTE family protein